jgi:hypothetical protein
MENPNPTSASLVAADRTKNVSEKASMALLRIQNNDFKDDQIEIGNVMYRIFRSLTSLNSCENFNEAERIVLIIPLGDKFDRKLCDFGNNIHHHIEYVQVAVGQHLPPGAFMNCTRLLSVASFVADLTNATNATTNATNATNATTNATNATTNGTDMFSGCSELRHVDVQFNDLISGTNMFRNCKKLSTMSGKSFPHLVSGMCMFDGCESLKRLVGSFDSLTDGVCMFRQCMSLKFDEVCVFPTLLRGKQMFSGCCSLSLECDSRFVGFPKLLDGEDMFASCESIRQIIGDQFPSLLYANRMFVEVDSLTIIKGIFANLIQANGMFMKCKHIAIVEASFPKLISGNSMFYQCQKLTSVYGVGNPTLCMASSDNVSGTVSGDVCDAVSGNVSGRHVGHSYFVDMLTSGVEMFFECSSLRKVVMNLTKCSDGRSMFHGCSCLKKLVLAHGGKFRSDSEFETDNDESETDGDESETDDEEDPMVVSAFLNLIQGESMFEGCVLLNTRLGYKEWFFPLLNVAVRMFKFCESINFNSRSTPIFPLVLDGTEMFSFCGEVYAVLGTWFPSLEVGEGMFSDCGIHHVYDRFERILIAQNMFRDCDMLLSIDADMFSTVTNGVRMFSNCIGLKWVDGTFTQMKQADFMFAGCSSLECADLMFPKLVAGNNLFEECHALQYVIIDAPQAEEISEIFSECVSLRVLVGSFDTVTEVDSFFTDCKDLTVVICSFGGLLDGSHMFDLINSLKVAQILVPKMVNGYRMFGECEHLISCESFDASLWKNSKRFHQTIESIKILFDDVETVNVFGKIQNDTNLFGFLNGIRGSFDSLTHGALMFYGCDLLQCMECRFPELVDATSMFGACFVFETAIITLPKLKASDEMFADCFALKSFRNMHSSEPFLPELHSSEHMFAQCALQNVTSLPQGLVLEIASLSLKPYGVDICELSGNCAYKWFRYIERYTVLMCIARITNILEAEGGIGTQSGLNTLYKLEAEDGLNENKLMGVTSYRIITSDDLWREILMYV